MLFGIALFIGGMVTLYIFSKLFGNTAVSQSSVELLPQAVAVEEQPVVYLRPSSEVLPVGELMDLNVVVSEQVKELYSPSNGFPCTSFDLDNHGPDPVFFCVNKWMSPQAPLNAGQSIHVDLKRQGGIKKVYLKCGKGQTSNVSLYILR